MDNRSFESGAVAGAPAAPAAPSVGYPTAGNPGLGIEATYPGPYWFHQLGEELRAVIAAAGITPDHAVLNQLLLALQGGFGLAKSIAANGYITLPGGLIIQWGSGGTDGSGVGTVVFPLAFPTALFIFGAFENAANPDLSLLVVGSSTGTTTGGSVYSQTVGGTAATTGVKWLAIGH